MIKRILVGIGIAALTLVLAGSVGMAQEYRERELVVIDREEVLEGPAFLIGETVTVLGTINGDTYVAGGQVTVDGTINGDLLVAGGEVTVNGVVTEDVRAFGGNVDFNGTIRKNLTVAGGNIELNPDALIGESFVGAGGNVSIIGLVSGQSIVSAGNVAWNGSTQDDVTINAGSLALNKSTNIAGNLTYRVDPSGTVQKSDDAVITGIITAEELPVSSKDFDGLEQALAGFGLIGTLVFFVGSLIIGALLVRFFPSALTKGNELVYKQPLKTLLIGLLSLIVTPILGIVLLATVVGLPLGMLLLLFYVIGIYFTKFFFGFWLGTHATKVLTNKPGNPYGNMIIGLALLTIFSIIPVLNAISAFATLFFGLGAVMLMKWDYFKTAK